MKTGGVEDPNTWFEDLTKAVQPILGSWVAIYAGIYKDKLEDKSLSIGEVAKDLRKEAERRSILHVNQKGPKITRGVFGPTFAEEQQPPEPTDIQKPTKEQDTLPQGQDKHGKRKAEHSPSSRRKRVATSRDTEATCRVCDGNHVLAQCYYVFPKTAPESGLKATPPNPRSGSTRGFHCPLHWQNPSGLANPPNPLGDVVDGLGGLEVG
ncbi:hypothetical protein BFJ68_g18576 [Fusarium oxysporum]|uniref:Uncharacterized protein n=4 Tax=Fusarium oxysporum TaxID=5507 RepID=A0A420MFQ6_FUSOX|nr:hypothetical protein BFJ68_g18576 [Fusarium oxysporum]